MLLSFALEGRVLVLDQPEDDLDNRFVHEDGVQIIREREFVKAIMESGEETFQRRAEKYGGLRARS